jgi:nicotinate-nucleotide adenylyltransferase
MGILFAQVVIIKPVAAREVLLMSKSCPRIGIYSGAFDPVHSGHIAFAVQAIAAAKLDRLYFMPERRPRNKQQVEHFAHRVAMLRRAVRPHRKFGVIEQVDINFSVERTLPKLQSQFSGSQLVFLHGSDDVEYIASWPHYERYLRTSELVIAVRSGYQIADVQNIAQTWHVQPKSLLTFESYAPDISSGKVRDALRRRQPVHGLLQSVAHYSNRHWLYVSLGQ